MTARQAFPKQTWFAPAPTGELPQNILDYYMLPYGLLPKRFYDEAHNPAYAPRRNDLTRNPTVGGLEELIKSLNSKKKKNG